MAKKTAVESVPENNSLTQRIKAIEARWGKEFTEVLVELHDHVFGASPPVEGAAAEAPAETKPDENATG